MNGQEGNNVAALVDGGLLGAAGTALLLRQGGTRPTVVLQPSGTTEGQPVVLVQQADLSQLTSLLSQILDSLQSQAALRQIQVQTQLMPSFITPSDLNSIIQASGKSGISLPLSQVAVLVPANGQVTVELRVPTNQVDIQQAPLLLTSDYYDANITVNIYVDGRLNAVTPSGISLTGPTRVNFGQYYVKRQSVTIDITNGTAKSITVSYQVQPLLISSALYDNFYARVIEYSVEHLGNIARQMGGTGL